jgi:anti-sigma factor RsiW
MKSDRFVELTCQEVTDLVTDYMSDALTAEERARFEQHLHACTWCMTYLSQMRSTVRLTRDPSPHPVPAATQKRLAEVFRRWKKGAKA